MQIAADVTERLRRALIAEIKAEPVDRKTLERRHGRVWDPGELGHDFVVVGFLAPLVVVDRKADGVRGSLEFQHDPRFYFNWEEDQQDEETL